jgi:hypothetical protein
MVNSKKSFFTPHQTSRHFKLSQDRFKIEDQEQSRINNCKLHEVLNVQELNLYDPAKERTTNPNKFPSKK